MLHEGPAERAPGTGARHYYLAVRARGRAQGAYALTVRVRSITTTDVSASGARFLEAAAGVSGIAMTNWLPPSVGHWRLRARFLGTRFSNTSVSPTVRILVTEPLEPEAGG